MSIEYKRVSWNAGTTTQQVYETPRGRTAIIIAASTVNINGSTQTFNIHLVNNEQSAVDQNKVVSERSLETNEEWLAYPAIGQVLEEMDSLYMDCSAEGAVNLRLSVKEIF